VSIGVVSKVMCRAEAAALTWADVAPLDEEALDVRLYGPVLSATAQRPMPDPVWIDIEKRKPGVTLELLHVEYLEAHPDGYRYTQFCEIYRRHLAKQRRSMRQTHVAGERAFVDYSGKRPQIIDPKTGEVTPVELFVGVLGASSYTFAEATLTQRSVDFIRSHVHMFEFFGGTPAIVTPDQLKSGVSSSCWYEPTIQRTYEELAKHYSVAVVPARPKKPKDKAKVECAVRIVQRWILARIRNEQFFSLEALNERIAALVEDLNDRPMRAYGGKTRRDLYSLLDKPVLKALPSERFVVGEWKQARVNIDYHIDVEKHLYSAPHTLVHEVVDVRVTAMTVEVFHRNERIASHVRSRAAGRATTIPAHMPKAHQEHLEWPPSRIVDWANTLGPDVGALVEAILAEKTHPEQGYRPCLGIIRLEKRFGAVRLNNACRRALHAGARSYRHVSSILKNRLDDTPLVDVNDGERHAVVHENVRGPDYYN
jgi:transposase